mgnify:CR=1 FL=1
MENRKMVPEIRFSGFTDPWEQCKLEDFVDKAVDNRGKTPPLDECGSHPLIEVAALGGVHPNYSKIEKYLSDDSFENSLRAYIKKGDILFATVGSIGLVSLMDSRDEAAIAQNIVAFRAKENFVPEYLYALFTNEGNQYKAKRIVMGAVQPSIKVSQLVNVEYKLTTNNKEQKKIGMYFSCMDTLITLHQRKLEKLKTFKKAMLDKMFPKNGELVPEIRFSGFTDPWEQCKLGDIGKASGGISIESEFDEFGKYKVISIGSYSVTNKYIDQGIRVNKTEKTENYILNKNDLTMILNDKTASGNIIGRVLLIDTDDSYVFNQRTERIEVNEDEYLPEFLYQLLNADNTRAKIILASQGNTQIYVNWRTISKLAYKITMSKDEQSKIAKIFTNVDNIITLHQRKLEKLQNIKKSMLNKMFI